MIKFTASLSISKTLFGFGLSEYNIEKLKKGMPIYVDGSTTGHPDVAVMILYGETEEQIAEIMSPMVGDHTIVHDYKDDEQGG